MFTWTLSSPWARSLFDHEQAHPDVAHQDLHGRLGVLVLEEQLDPVLGAHRSGLGHALDQPPPRVDVRRLERVVVALAAGPDDQVGAQRPGERSRLAHDPSRLRAHRRIRIDQAAPAEARIQVQTAGYAVDIVIGPECGPDFVEVRRRELLRVVELVAVDEVSEALDRPVHLLGHRLRFVAVLGLVAGRDEPCDHRSERPDAQARLHHRSFEVDACGAILFRGGS